MTPCEKLGYKVGDEFEYTGDVEFDTGDKIVLIDDDGSDQPDFRRENDSLEQCCFLGDVRPLPVTLQKGDYCSTANMTESEYHAVAAAFMAAGCDADMHGHLDYGKVPSQPYLEWYRTDLCSTTKPEPGGRHLTPAQIIGAVNAKSATRAVEQCRCVMTPVIKEKPMHPIDNLHTKRQARDVAEQQYQAALAEVREKLGDKFMLAEVSADMASGSDWTATATNEDMTDPANWRAGDLVERISGKSPNIYTQGKIYEVKSADGDRVEVYDDLGGGSYCGCGTARAAENFKWHSRP